MRKKKKKKKEFPLTREQSRKSIKFSIVVAHTQLKKKWKFNSIRDEVILR